MTQILFHPPFTSIEMFHSILTLKPAGGGDLLNQPPRFFGLKSLPLDQLPNAFAQLFLDNKKIF